MQTKKAVITMPIDYAIKNGLNEPKNFNGDFSYNGKTFKNMKVLRVLILVQILLI